jgi:hypothetical protein
MDESKKPLEVPATNIRREDVIVLVKSRPVVYDDHHTNH